jgi:hypothetical protein
MHIQHRAPSKTYQLLLLKQGAHRRPGFLVWFGEPRLCPASANCSDIGERRTPVSRLSRMVFGDTARE